MSIHGTVLGADGTRRNDARRRSWRFPVAIVGREEPCCFVAGHGARRVLSHLHGRQFDIMSASASVSTSRHACRQPVMLYLHRIQEFSSLSSGLTTAGQNVNPHQCCSGPLAPRLPPSIYQSLAWRAQEPQNPGYCRLLPHISTSTPTQHKAEHHLASDVHQTDSAAQSSRRMQMRSDRARRRRADWVRSRSN